jgi:hypothetical protein
MTLRIPAVESYPWGVAAMDKTFVLPPAPGNQIDRAAINELDKGSH